MVFSFYILWSLLLHKIKKNNTLMFLRRVYHATKLHQMFAAGLYVSHLAIFEWRHNCNHGRSVNQWVEVLQKHSQYVPVSGHDGEL